MQESRTQRLKQRLLDSPFEVCAERAVLWTESARQTEGKPQVIRNAMALKNLLEKMTIFINDGELIVGNRTSKKKGAPLFPETKSFSIETQIDTYEFRPIQPYLVGAQEKEAIKKVLPYWRGKSVWERAFKDMPRAIQKDVFSFTFAVEAEFANGIGHYIVGNHNLLAKGFAGIKEQALKKLQSEKQADQQQKDFWQAVVISSDAAIAFAGRFAALARSLAEKENDPARKQELLKIAEVCENVPTYPPRDFHEAVQAVWFNQLICQLECGGFAISPGRLDQVLYPFYKRDLESGKITPEKAQELLECLYIKMSGVVNVLDTVLLPVTSGPPIAQSLTIGGTDGQGKDATNELSFLFLAALDNIRTVMPNLAVRFHPATPPEFLLKVCDAVRRGAMMALFNDEVILPSLRSSGIPIEEARDYAIVGCVEPTTNGGTFASTDSNLVNIARCLELALKNGDGIDLLEDRKYMLKKFGPSIVAGKNGKSNGKSARKAQNSMLLNYGWQMRRRTNLGLIDLYRMLRGKQIGVKSGAARNFQSMDEVLRAYHAQVGNAVARMVQAMEYCDCAHAALKPTPFISSTVDDCIEKGRDVTRGGARYNFTGPQAIGLADVADSLAAIKRLVFDERKISMAGLLEAMSNDFRDAEPLRQMLVQKAPKYGNDDPAADELAQKAAEIYCLEVSKHKNFRGGKFRPGVYSMSGHLVFGVLTGALPDGRRKGESLAAGLSPVSGMEMKGPTAVMRSVAKVDAKLISNGSVLNMKFDPSLLKGEDNLNKFAALNRAYFKLGGLQVQYNIVDPKMLRDAQDNPERYCGLVVRVAGYSALFTQLDRATQNDIINRVSHGCEG